MYWHLRMPPLMSSAFVQHALPPLTKARRLLLRHCRACCTLSRRSLQCNGSYLQQQVRPSAQTATVHPIASASGQLCKAAKSGQLCNSAGRICVSICMSYTAGSSTPGWDASTCSGRPRPCTSCQYRLSDEGCLACMTAHARACWHCTPRRRIHAAGVWTRCRSPGTDDWLGSWAAL